jgi:hypothetical protein
MVIPPSISFVARTRHHPNLSQESSLDAPYKSSIEPIKAEAVPSSPRTVLHPFARTQIARRTQEGTTGDMSSPGDKGRVYRESVLKIVVRFDEP